jgi:hypothetical protein
MQQAGASSAMLTQEIAPAVTAMQAIKKVRWEEGAWVKDLGSLETEPIAAFPTSKRCP